MNINTVEDLNNYLQQILEQLQIFNYINSEDLKNICFIQTQTINNTEETNILINNIFQLINQNTKIIKNKNLLINNMNLIFNGFLNKNLKQLYGD